MNRAPALRTVLWHDPEDTGLERCFLLRDGSGHLLGGTALLAVRDAPCEVRYRIWLDEAWRTRHVEVERFGPGDDARIAIDVDLEGDRRSARNRWTVDGAEPPELDGCQDVDLEFTPATNTIPMRRLGLAVGEHADLLVAWVRFPSLRVEPAAQRYRRTADRSWEFRSGSFRAALSVDGAGLVLRYGNAWRQVASDQRETAQRPDGDAGGRILP